MGLFDFWKKKNKESEQQPLDEQSVGTEEQFTDTEEQQSDSIEIEGLEIQIGQEEESDFVLNVDESLSATTALNRAVRKAMQEETVTIHQAAGGILHQEGVKETPEDAIEPESEYENMEEELIVRAEPKAEEAEPEEAPVEAEEEAEPEEAPIEVEEETEPEEAPIEVEEETEPEEAPVEAEEETEPEEAPVEAEEEAEPEETPAEAEGEAEEAPKKKGFFARLKDGLDKTRKNILDGVDSVLGSFTKIDEELFEELEETLIMADIGVQTTMDIVENLRQRVKKERATDPSCIKGMLIDEITAILEEENTEEENLPSPTVMLVIGVNGVGKTTTIGKLAHNFKEEGKSVLLAAADTFRAAAIDQLEIWGERAKIDVIKHEENADPAAVVYDAVHAAKNKKSDLLICDTAGRLHNKKNLMEELKKISRVMEREYPTAHRETYLVLDATTGQNALQQAKLFQEVAGITGIILTKLDGTAKGGIVVAIKSEMQIPVRYIGVGEGIDDLQKFDAKEFAKALFGEA